MAAMWFLVFYLLLATTSLAELQENDLHQKQSGIHLNIYHVQGPGSSLTPKSPLFFFDVLSRDEERVKALHSRLANKDASSSTTSASFSKKSGGPKSVSIPSHPGLSIAPGNYYVKIGLGTPAKYYAMVIDSGSSLAWLQCQPCTIRCHTQEDPLFDPSSSMTYKKLSCATSQCSSLRNASLSGRFCDDDSDPCVYTTSYGDNSFSLGFLSQDLLTLTPSQRMPRFVYGCGQYQEGPLGKTAGILGLARDQFSLIAQLSTKYGYAFSYCLPTAASTKGGCLSIGNSSLAAFSAYKFTPMFTNSQDPSLYHLKLKAITVAGRQLGVAAAQYRVPTIIDSGTYITRLPVSVYTALRQTFVNIMSKKYEQAPEFSILDACFKGSLKSMSVLVPKIQLIFQGGADLTLKTPNVLIQIVEGLTCLAFAPTSGPHETAIIGNYQQQTFGVAYDVSNFRIKFAAGRCH